MVSSNQQQHQQQVQPKRRTGGRKPREQETQLPPEEEEKRRLRRIRNKEAAARCRKRRVDHMNTLEDEVNKLNEQYKSMEEELNRLTQEREQLKFILTAHEPVCQLKNEDNLRLKAGEMLASLSLINSSTVSGGATDMMNNNNKKQAPFSHDPTLSSVSVGSALSTISEVIDLQTQSSSGASSGSGSASSLPISTTQSRDLLLCRPNTLSIAPLAGHRGGFPPSSNTPLSVTGGAGLPIETPSKIGDYDPMNGPTGFTPISITQPNDFAQILGPSNLASLETPITDVKTITKLL